MGSCDGYCPPLIKSKRSFTEILEMLDLFLQAHHPALDHALFFLGLFYGNGGIILELLSNVIDDASSDFSGHGLRWNDPIDSAVGLSGQP